jgi:hypothetical protein
MFDNMLRPVYKDKVVKDFVLKFEGVKLHGDLLITKCFG